MLDGDAGQGKSAVPECERCGDPRERNSPDCYRQSTLAAILAGREGYEIASGRVLYDGQDLLDMDPEEPKKHIRNGLMHEIRRLESSQARATREYLTDRGGTKDELKTRLADIDDQICDLREQLNELDAGE